jgi:phytoene desaturase (3,4-didehydrolycopene-forming)
MENAGAASPTNSNACDLVGINLVVGERCFRTTKDTLTEESGYFRALLSDRWRSQPSNLNGSSDGEGNSDNGPASPGGFNVFVDGDGDLFVHVLRYLRRGIFPLLLLDNGGVDHAQYAALREEALFYEIPALAAWIGGKKYLEALMVERTARVVNTAEELTTPRPTLDERVEYFPAWTTRRVYLCPRRIDVHRGKPELCGRQCHNARGDQETEFEEEPVLHVLVVHSKTSVNTEKLRAAE